MKISIFKANFIYYIIFNFKFKKRRVFFKVNFFLSKHKMTTKKEWFPLKNDQSTKIYNKKIEIFYKTRILISVIIFFLNNI